jgi:hypothetical protein
MQFLIVISAVTGYKSAYVALTIKNLKQDVK